MATKKIRKKPEDVSETEIIRPERASLTPEEALKRMEEFAEKRKEKLVAAVRKGKS